MKKMFVAACLAGLVAGSAFADRPRLNCISDDGVKRVRIQEGPFGDMRAEVFHNEAILKVLKCYEDEPRFLYRCGTRHRDGSWDDTDSIFELRRSAFVPFGLSEARYIGQDEQRYLSCRHRREPLN